MASLQTASVPLPVTHIGDIGTLFTVTVLNNLGAILNLSGATVLTFTFQHQSGTVIVVTPTFVTNGTGWAAPSGQTVHR